MFGLYKQLKLLPTFKNWGHFTYNSDFLFLLGRKSDRAAVGLLLRLSCSCPLMWGLAFW